MGGKSSIQLPLLFLLIAALCLEAQPRYQIYPMFDLWLNWTEARLYCQRHYTDMVRWNTASRADLVDLMSSNGVTIIWTGDRGDPQGASDNFTNGESEEILRELCFAFGQDIEQGWPYAECQNEFPFICYEEDNLVIIKENKTWEDALKHCREMNASCVDDKGHQTHCYNLLSLPDPSDYDFVMDKLYRATTDEVWTGLRFLGGEWWWLNGETVGDHEMLPECPSQWKHCGSISKYVSNRSVIRDCSERRNFMCEHKKKAVNGDNDGMN
ncbi:uncharacterized protein LOC118469392 [Amphiprion ocellaris]|uniref:uncharacterized protein LOC118469392 n=1 Tax=Amphiprion ocellaris TaxID=80972 RepID=UPI002410D73B|nr:uncharacterized protein LOC118469392 [Amphiprion ocellaris]